MTNKSQQPSGNGAVGKTMDLELKMGAQIQAVLEGRNVWFCPTLPFSTSPETFECEATANEL
jgi:hypothetical protein